MSRRKKIRYSKKMDEVAAQAAANGAGNDKLAEILGCHPTTLYRWLNERPSFAQAVEEARKPPKQGEKLEELELWNKLMREWFTEYLTNRGTVMEVRKYDNGIAGNYKSVRKGGLPDFRLVEKLLGVQAEPDKFEISVTIAEPDDDLDDDLDDEDED